MTTDKNSLSDRDVIHRIEQLRNDLQQSRTELQQGVQNICELLATDVSAVLEETVATKFLLNRVAEKLGIDVKNEEKKDLK